MDSLRQVKFFSTDCEPVVQPPPIYHRMDRTIVEMPLDYRKYYDKPDYSGAAPPACALPIPRFFHRRSTSPPISKATDSSFSDESSRKLSMAKASSNRTSVSVTITASQEKLPISNAETEEKGSRYCPEICEIPFSDDSIKIPGTELSSKRQSKTQPIDKSQKATNTAERYTPFQPSRPNRSWTWKTSDNRDLRSTARLLCPLCLHPVQNLFVQQRRNQNMLCHLQAKLEINIAKQRSLRIEASDTQPFKIVGSDGARVYW